MRNCKDCNDTRIYQPLIGPPEPCQACLDTGINSMLLIAKLLVPNGISQDAVDGIKDIIISRAKIPCCIEVDKRGRVTQGATIVLAPLGLQDDFSALYNILVPGHQVAVTVCVRTSYDLCLGPIRFLRSRISHLHFSRACL